MYNEGLNFTTDQFTSTTSPDFWNNLNAGFAVFFVILGFFALAIIIFLIVSQCKMFKKAGEAWWKALVPVYSTWIEAKIGGLAWWWCPIYIGVAALATFNNLAYGAGLATVVISFNFYYNISKKFEKSNGFAVLCTLLPFIGIPILAFGSSKYNASTKTDKNGIFAIENSIAK